MERQGGVRRLTLTWTAPTADTARCASSSASLPGTLRLEEEIEAWRTAYAGIQSAIEAASGQEAGITQDSASTEHREQEQSKPLRLGWAGCLLAALLGWAVATAANVFRRSG